MNSIKDKKYAIMLGEERITDYMYDEIIQTTNTLYGIINETKNITTIHAYSKQNGGILFKKSGISIYEFHGDSLVMEQCDTKCYVYFDSINTIRGPFDDIEAKGIYLIVEKEGKKILYGVYNVWGERILPLKYNYICVITDELLEVGYKDGKIGLVNHKGEYLLEPIYSNLRYYFNNTFITFWNEKAKSNGVINKYGTFLLPCKYDDIVVDEEDELIYIQQNSLYGIYKYDKGVVFFPTFRSLKKNCEVIELIGLDDKTYGYIPKLDLLLPRRYYTYYENYLKYFDGFKWRKLKYDKK